MKADRSTAARRRRQRGVTLLEALIGFLVVAIGWLGAAQMQLHLRQGSDLARQQAEAGRLAQHRIEALRARIAAAAAPSAAEMAEDDASAAALAGDARYRMATSMRESDATTPLAIEVEVRWSDATGAEQRIALSGALAAHPAALALPLTIARASRHTGPVDGRHAAIPRDAVDLGDGRSLFKPAAAGTQAWLFDNRSARITARCSVASGLSGARLAGADLSACETHSALLLSGRMRIAAPGADTLGAEVALRRPDGGPAAADCVSEAARLVEIGQPPALRTIAVAADADAADHGHERWREVGDRHIRYHCAVAPQAASGARRPHWAGRLQIVPAGWTAGSSAGTLRVCRHASDSDASGALDRPAEAPEVYAGVDEALVEQNYLVVDGTLACPGPAGTVAATVPHQP